ncbi:MAG TPA: hypothetical protein VGL99_34130 [Chloroflexota bacterium]
MFDPYFSSVPIGTCLDHAWDGFQFGQQDRLGRHWAARASNNTGFVQTWDDEYRAHYST